MFQLNSQKDSQLQGHNGRHTLFCRRTPSPRDTNWSQVAQ